MNRWLLFALGLVVLVLVVWTSYQYHH